MSENSLSFVIGLEIVTAILATFFSKKYNASSERYFVYFLWFTVLIEVSGGLMRFMFSVENFWLYNIYMVVGFLFYFYWYYSILKQKSFQKTVLIFSILFTGVALWSFVFQNWSEYHKYTFVVGALFTLIAAVFHFWQLLYGDEILIIKYKLSFWISTGLLLFYMGMVPFMLLSRYFKLTGTNYYILIISLNSILYGCYIIGFLWAKEKYNRF